jgi:hypothetical protein
MWINNSVSRPLREGTYRTLVDWDGLGNLNEQNNEYFNGIDWDVYESLNQFILYWWVNEEDYKTIADKLEKETNRFYCEAEETCEQQCKECKL